MQVLDPCIETWLQRETAGDPPHGVSSGAFAASHSHLYHYGGGDGSSRYGDLSRFCPATIILWTNASRHSASGPMKKIGCHMICCSDILVLFGGLGKLTGQVQPGSTFVEHDLLSDGNGYTDEFYIFDTWYH